MDLTDPATPDRSRDPGLPPSEADRAHHALRDSEALLAAVAQHVPVGLGIHNARGQILALNPAGLRMHGFDSLDALRQTVENNLQAFALSDLDGKPIPVEDWPINRAVRGDFVTDHVIRLHRPDGQERVIAYTVQPVAPTDAFRGEDSGQNLVLFVLHDITDRRRSATDLQRVQALIEGITAGTDDLIAAQDAEFRYIYFNAAYQRVFENLWGQELRVGTSMLEALAAWPEEQRKAKQLWSRAHEGEAVRETMAFGPSDEKQRVFDLRFNPVLDADGRQIAAAHILRDVTDRVEIENALRESEERFRTLADNMSQLCWMADPTGWIFWYNRRWYEYTGTTLEQMQGWGWKAVHHPDHVDRVVERVQHSWDTGELWEDTFPLRSAEGEYRWFLSRAVPIRDEHGAIVRWFGTNTDVTEQREAEQALRESEQRFRRMADSAPAMLWIADAWGQTTYISRAWQTYTGQSQDEALGSGWTRMVHPDDRERSFTYFVQMRDRQQPFRTDYRLRTANGEYRWAMDVGQPRFDDEGRFAGYVGSVIDIHDRITAQRQLQEVNATLEARVQERTRQVRQQSEHVRELSLEVLEAEERERQRLAMQLHDDLQQVLAAVRMRLGLLRNHLPETHWPQWAGVDDLLVQSIASTRTLAQELSPPILRQESLATALEWLAKHFHERHDLTVHAELDRAAELVDADLRHFLFRAARELLFNVVKHAGTQEAWLTLERHDGEIRLSVVDRGQGCDLPSLEGTGLGLFSITQRAERLGGWSAIDTQPGGGCRIQLAVPAGGD